MVAGVTTRQCKFVNGRWPLGTLMRSYMPLGVTVLRKIKLCKKVYKNSMTRRISQCLYTTYTFVDLRTQQRCGTKK